MTLLGDAVASAHAPPSATRAPGGPRDDPSDDVFRREGEEWLVAFGGDQVRLRDSKGLQHLARLLAQPGQDIPAIELTGRTEPIDGGTGSATGAGGQATERARLSVSRAVRAAIDRIAGHHPVLAAHLRATVRTGVVCSYRPDPHARRRWRT